MEIELVAAQIEITPDTLAMIVLCALAPTHWTMPRTAPLQANIHTSPLEIELRFRHVPGVFNPKQPTKQLGIAHFA